MVSEADLKWFRDQKLSPSIIERLINPQDKPMGVVKREYYTIEIKKDEGTK
jgi:hypothetical protein